MWREDDMIDLYLDIKDWFSSSKYEIVSNRLITGGRDVDTNEPPQANIHLREKPDSNNTRELIDDNNSSSNSNKYYPPNEMCATHIDIKSLPINERSSWYRNRIYLQTENIKQRYPSEPVEIDIKIIPIWFKTTEVSWEDKGIIFRVPFDDMDKLYQDLKEYYIDTKYDIIDSEITMLDCTDNKPPHAYIHLREKESGN